MTRVCTVSSATATATAKTLDDRIQQVRIRSVSSGRREDLRAHCTDRAFCSPSGRGRSGLEQALAERCAAKVSERGVGVRQVERLFAASSGLPIGTKKAW